MSGRTPPPRTRFSRVPCDVSGVTVLKVSGSLGPRAKPQLVRLTQECLERNLPRLVLDLSEVDALGGGTARLLNEFAAERTGRGGKTAFRVTSRTVRAFLNADAQLPPPPLVASLDEAIASVAGSGESQRRTEPPGARPISLSASAPVPVSPRQRPLPMEFDRRALPPFERDTPDDSDPGLLFLSEDEALDGALPPRAVESRRTEPPRPSAPRTPPKDMEPRRAERSRRDTAPAPQRRTAPQLATPRGIDAFEQAHDPWIGAQESARQARGTDKGAAPARVVTTPSTVLRDRLATVLRERGVASRLFLFELDPDGSYYLVTRHGADHERGFPAAGALAKSVLAGMPMFLIDIDLENLSDGEAEVLGELNCEVSVPVGSGDPPPFLAFLSKEQPGDEFSLEDLQELEDVLLREAPAPGASTPDAPPPAPPSHRHPELAPLFAENAGNEPAERQERGGKSVQTGSFLVQERDRPAPIRVADEPPTAPVRGTTPEQVRALRRSVAQMRDILAMTHDFDASFGSSKLLEVMVLAVVSVARVETVLYFALQDGDYVLSHHRGLSSDTVAGLRLRGDSSLVERGLASPRGVEIADSAQISEEERIWSRQHGLQWGVPFRYKDETLGLLLLGGAAEDAPPDMEMLAWLLAQAGLAYDRARLYETLQDRTLGVVRGLITLIEARNAFDCGSTEQVVRYTQALARELQFPADQLRDLIYGAVLRDVGMLKVSEALLRSSSDLTADQWETIRQHPQEGTSIMRQMRFGPVAVDVVLHHHETYNGEGYPMGLRGRSIPLGARIVAVAESYVKMTMDRPYRKALTKPEALESLAENWGLRYDPLVVDALVRVVNRELSLGLKPDRDLTKDLFGV